MEHKYDKLWNEISGQDRWEGQYYKQWIYGMDNMQFLFIRCQQIFKKMMSITICKPHNIIYLQIVQWTQNKS